MATINKADIEMGNAFIPKFDANGLVPVIVQDIRTKIVLMLAYMNLESIEKTLACGEMVYYSRSRKALWHKGKTSGSIQKVVTLSTDCDQDTILAMVKVSQQGACHNGYETCFYRNVISSDTLERNHTSQCFEPSEVYKK